MSNTLPSITSSSTDRTCPLVLPCLARRPHLRRRRLHLLFHRRVLQVSLHLNASTISKPIVLPHCFLHALVHSPVAQRHCPPRVRVHPRPRAPGRRRLPCIRIRPQVPRIHGRYAQFNARPRRPCTLPSLCSHLLLPFYTDNLSEKGVHEVNARRFVLVAADHPIVVCWAPHTPPLPRSTRCLTHRSHALPLCSQSAIQENADKLQVRRVATPYLIILVLTAQLRLV